ncbi:hypothetical protein K435DRAFT_888691 [Dendrothele bispora CBS 962.96]|uniref:Uncharacterized protein n=1 Tax=Dendrothele bispora (strain CBS 962.96) TaxID=1314807 RepID=A0A4S8M5I6_DENBC|nr:hypothetical protein K435DRAFT_888691 [Dendrothele bispora CBS 962.96]
MAAKTEGENGGKIRRVGEEEAGGSIRERKANGLGESETIVFGAEFEITYMGASAVRVKQHSHTNTALNVFSTLLMNAFSIDRISNAFRRNSHESRGCSTCLRFLQEYVESMCKSALRRWVWPLSDIGLQTRGVRTGTRRSTTASGCNRQLSGEYKVSDDTRKPIGPRNVAAWLMWSGRIIVAYRLSATYHNETSYPSVTRYLTCAVLVMLSLTYT